MATASPFATDIQHADPPAEISTGRKGSGQYAPSGRQDKPWAEGDPGAAEAKVPSPTKKEASSAAYGNFDTTGLTVERPGPKLGDSKGGVPFATEYNADARPTMNPKDRKDLQPPWGTN
eukprot:m.335659 g.335659  ORF g.335659 m.335659 type:complete len:119 (+) comp17645_c0_seq1:77-433(+)